MRWADLANVESMNHAFREDLDKPAWVDSTTIKGRGYPRSIPLATSIMLVVGVSIACEEIAYQVPIVRCGYRYHWRSAR